jgi:uncharacterized protein
MTARRARLPGERWHFQHGPIDLVIGADGPADAVAAAHDAAWARFDALLGELVAELPRLRQPVAGPCLLRGQTARRMWQACAPLVEAADGFITPMAAVAGAVAQTLIEAYRRPGIARAWINNGGDIALHLAAGERLRVGLFADLAGFDAAMAQRSAQGHLALDAGFAVQADDPVRGIATSGWRGRSFSLGIADSVTVLAATAAMADAAATVVANAVDLDDAGIARRPACSLRDDSDLGDRLVTVDVPVLPPARVQQALQRGLACATELQRQGLIHAAVLVCQGQHEVLVSQGQHDVLRARQPLESVLHAETAAA